MKLRLRPLYYVQLPFGHAISFLSIRRVAYFCTIADVWTRTVQFSKSNRRAPCALQERTLYWCTSSFQSTVESGPLKCLLRWVCKSLMWFNRGTAVAFICRKCSNQTHMSFRITVSLLALPQTNPIDVIPFTVSVALSIFRLADLRCSFRFRVLQEWSYIPVGGALPVTTQPHLAFGAAANMVHPATGQLRSLVCYPSRFILLFSLFASFASNSHHFETYCSCSQANLTESPSRKALRS